MTSIYRRNFIGDEFARTRNTEKEEDSRRRPNAPLLKSHWTPEETLRWRRQATPSRALAARFMPDRIPFRVRPMVATLVAQAFERSRWVYEEKYDGYRILAY